MNFKEKFNVGNNFILSPNGVISRKRYFLYAILLEIIYRKFNSIGSILGKEVYSLFYIVCFLTIPIIILKLFNYKKRAFSFLNNNFLAYIYSITYIILGACVQLYSYFFDIYTKKSLYEITLDDAFKQYANINIPSYIGSNNSQIIFCILCGIGFIMFIALISIPSKLTQLNITKNSKIEESFSKQVD